MKIGTPIADCRMCRSPQLTEVLDLGEQALSGTFPRSRDEEVPAGPLRLVWCGGCGLVQLGESYDLSALYGPGYGYRSGLNGSMVEHLHGKVAEIEKLVPLGPGDTVVDIGSNDGTLLSGYTVPGLRRIGIDPLCETFAEHYPPDVERLSRFFNTSLIRRIGKAKVITSIAMFYDLERPLDFVSDVADCLTDDGVWVFEQSYLPSMVSQLAFDTVCHEHFEYYDLRAVARAVSRFGLKIINVEFNRINGGSFSVTAAKRDSLYRRLDLSHILASEAASGFDTVKPFGAFRQNLAYRREELLRLLLDLKRKRKTVLGYGASTKGNVLLQYCGITEDLLPAIAEVNEDKFGAFTPGSKIPIISEADARRMKPDYFFVLPWHFRDNIVAKEEAIVQGGGRSAKLIFPLPTLEIVE